MTAGWALYALVSAALFAGAGRAGARLSARRGWPRRWAWAAAVGGAVLVAPTLVVALELAAASPPASTEPFLVAMAGSAPAGAPGAAGGEPAGRIVRAGRRLLDATGPWIGGAWVAISAFYFLRLGARWLRLRSRSSPWREEAGIELRRLPDRGPAAMGWQRPLILLPGWFFELDDRRQEMVLAHEREHIRAGDHRLLAAAAVLLGAAPWNPALRWTVRRLREAVELDCDRRLARAGVDRAAYARLLLESESRRKGGGVPFAASASESRVGRRVRSLLCAGPGRGKRASALGTAAVVACLGAVGVAAEGFRDIGAAAVLAAGHPSAAAADGGSLRCREVADAGHRTDAVVRLRRGAASRGAVVTVREEPDPRPRDGDLALAVRAPDSGARCTVRGPALSVEVGPGSLDGAVGVRVSTGGRIRVLDELTGRTASIGTGSPGRTRTRCAFGPGDRFACRPVGD